MGLVRSIKTHYVSGEEAVSGTKYWFEYPPQPERLELAGAVETLAAQDPAFAASEIGQKTFTVAKNYLSVLDKHPVAEAHVPKQPDYTFRRRLKDLFRRLKPPSSGKG